MYLLLKNGCNMAQENLYYYSFSRESVGTRHISAEDIPNLVDEYDIYEDVFFGKRKLDNDEKLVKVKGIYEYVNNLNPPISPQIHVPYRIIAQQASLFSGQDRVQKIYDRLVKYGLVSSRISRNNGKNPISVQLGR